MLSKLNDVWIVKWKKSRNHRGHAEVIGQKSASKLADEKRAAGFKVEMKTKGGNHGH